MSIKIQNFRSSTAGQTPGGLLPGEIAFNLADNYLFLGYGGDINYDVEGDPLPTPPPAGQGWRTFPLVDAVGGVTKLNAGTNVTLDPSSGLGSVTINADPAPVSQLVAGTNVTLDPADGLGTVTINATVPGDLVTSLVAGTNVTLSPSTGLGDVTINADVPAATPSVLGGVFAYSDTTNGNLGLGSSTMGSVTVGQALLNVGVGLNCLDALTTGDNNTAVGNSAGGGLTSGSNNACVGTNAGAAITTGNFNTFIGSSAGSGSNGQQCTFIGYQAGQSGTNQGTCVGYNAGRTATGLNNTLIGNSSGSLITTGGYNTIVGPYVGATTLSTNVVLADGNGTIRFQSNASGACSLGTGGAYGNSGQVLASGGSGAAPSWTSALPFVNVPASSTAAGVQGQIAHDSTYFYYCVGGISWKRIAWDTTPW